MGSSFGDGHDPKTFLPHVRAMPIPRVFLFFDINLVAGQHDDGFAEAAILSRPAIIDVGGEKMVTSIFTVLLTPVLDGFT